LGLPPEFESLTGPTTLVTSPIKRYLLDRGVTQQDIVQWKMGYCATGDYEGRVIIPSFSVDGVLNYFVARSYNGNWKKYMNPPVSRNIIFNELMVDWGSPVVLVEGVFDAIIAGTNAVPLLGSELREDSNLFQRIAEKRSKVFLALDPDVEKKSFKIIKKMLTYGAELAKIEVRPYSDVGEMSKKEFQKRKQAATSVSKSFGDYFSYLLGHTVKI
jgi:DNA primase